MAPRTKESFEKIRTEKKALILDAALELFASEGYHVTSVSKIAQAAGISKGLIYNYFESKEEILETLVFTTMEELLDMIDPNKDGVMTDEEFVYMIDMNFKWLEANSDFLKLYFAMMLQPTVLKLVEVKLMELTIPVFKVISNYFDSKGCENPMIEARYLNSLLDGININYAIDPTSIPLDAMKQKVLQQYAPYYNSI
ncbi:MAG: TetR/AcrR family transcriptional regulator [Marinilabiliaceae bacterium]|nr:TetR/AcrR family transcriptional regulator [Marinilabiliaceae bacterium]